MLTAAITFTGAALRQRDLEHLAVKATSTYDTKDGGKSRLGWRRSSEGILPPGLGRRTGACPDAADMRRLEVLSRMRNHGFQVTGRMKEAQ